MTIQDLFEYIEKIPESERREHGISLSHNAGFDEAESVSRYTDGDLRITSK